MATRQSFFHVSVHEELLSYHYLNLIDNSNCEKISVAPIPNKGLGRVINDRLKKASYKKKIR